MDLRLIASRISAKILEFPNVLPSEGIPKYEVDAEVVSLKPESKKYKSDSQVSEIVIKISPTKYQIFNPKQFESIINGSGDSEKFGVLYDTGLLKFIERCAKSRGSELWALYDPDSGLTPINSTDITIDLLRSMKIYR